MIPKFENANRVSEEGKKRERERKRAPNITNEFLMNLFPNAIVCRRQKAAILPWLYFSIFFPPHGECCIQNSKQYVPNPKIVRSRNSGENRIYFVVCALCTFADARGRLCAALIRDTWYWVMVYYVLHAFTKCGKFNLTDEIQEFVFFMSYFAFADVPFAAPPLVFAASLLLHYTAKAAQSEQHRVRGNRYMLLVVHSLCATLEWAISRDSVHATRLWLRTYSVPRISPAMHSHFDLSSYLQPTHRDIGVFCLMCTI